MLCCWQVSEVEAAGSPAVAIAKEGEDTASAQKCTFMELAICLASGLPLIMTVLSNIECFAAHG